MPERIQTALKGLLEKIKNLEKKQKIRLFATIFVVLISIIITAYLATRPDWIVLDNNISSDMVLQYQTALDELGYKHRIIDRGTGIEVEKKNYDKIKVNLTSKEIGTQDDFTFEDALSLSGMGSTEMIKKASLKHAKESELSRSLLMFDGIESATVSLALPETNNYFIKDTEKASAAVAINISKDFDMKQTEAIARYIAANVVGLDIENVEILDQKAVNIYIRLFEKKMVLLHFKTK